MENETYHETASVEQNRFEVLWRTLLNDHDKTGEAHPAPGQLGDIYMRRLKGFLFLQISLVNLQDIKEMLEQVLEDAVGREDDPFFAQCIANLGLEENGMLTLTNELLESMPGAAEPNKNYIREAEINALVEINTKLAILSGILPFDTADRLIPPLWHGCLEALMIAAAARDARDFKKFQASISQGIVALTSSNVMSQTDRDSSGFIDSLDLFATHSGRLGVNPGGAEVGDEIWLLVGLHVPIILRNWGQGRYKAVGCSYIHGIMHGEAVPGDKAAK
ncbi:hypothetical protein S40288_09145 [Stachybotrys chartarum IBT 40288]|nr:hypothetical protein S40288_09145 [Stachybotrys chartarum IBT 40288]